jgi:hypothetical protein
MKVLVLFITKENNINFISNIILFRDLMNKYYDIDYGCISSNNDFEMYDNIIDLKYKEIIPKQQLSKLNDFILLKKNELEIKYDWIIKTRPDIKLKQLITFNNLSTNAINARARCYKGPKRIKYANSVGDKYKYLKHCKYWILELEKNIVLDDQLFIFHKSILNKFKNIPENLIKEWYFIPLYNDIFPSEHEWVHNHYWRFCNVNLNVIGINLDVLYENGDIRYNSIDLNL